MFGLNRDQSNRNTHEQKPRPNSTNFEPQNIARKNQCERKVIVYGQKNSCTVEFFVISLSFAKEKQIRTTTHLKNFYLTCVYLLYFKPINFRIESERGKEMKALAKEMQRENCL